MEASISDLARILGKSERTIARYLKNGQIAATRRENGMYEVDETALLALRPHDENTLILQRLAEISAQLGRIEQMLAGQQPYKQIAPRSRIVRDTSQPALLDVPTAEAPADLPAGSIHINDLAAEIGRSRGALYDQVVKKTYHAVSTPKANRPKEKDWWFSPEEAARIRADYRNG